MLGTSSLVLEGFAPGWSWVVDTLQPLLIFFLIGVALYRARYYRLTRTRWRGIRAGQTGSSARYGVMVAASYLATVFSAGLAWPWSQVWLFRYKMNNTWLGNRRFVFDGSAAGLYPSYLVAWATTVVLPFVFVVLAGAALVVSGVIDDFDLGEPFVPSAMDESDIEMTGWVGGAMFVAIALAVFAATAAWQWYNAAKYRLFARHSRLDSLGFTMELSGWGLAKFTLANLALTLFSLGLALPWVLHRQARFFAKRLMAHGAVDYAGVGQSPLRAPETGEGLADAFDIGGI